MQQQHHPCLLHVRTITVSCASGRAVQGAKHGAEGMLLDMGLKLWLYKSYDGSVGLSNYRIMLV